MENASEQCQPDLLITPLGGYLIVSPVIIPTPNLPLQSVGLCLYQPGFLVPRPGPIVQVKTEARKVLRTSVIAASLVTNLTEGQYFSSVSAYCFEEHFIVVACLAFLFWCAGKRFCLNVFQTYCEVCAIYTSLFFPI